MKIRQILSTVAVLGGWRRRVSGLYRFTTVQASHRCRRRVRKGEFLVTVRCRGELKARRTVQITAPLNVPELRIVWMAAAGSPVKEGDPVVRFDPSSTKQQMDENRRR
jgi:multidrug efflux pump subunit AcrA (membrane-fusion protein)